MNFGLKFKVINIEFVLTMLLFFGYWLVLLSNVFRNELTQLTGREVKNIQDKNNKQHKDEDKQYNKQHKDGDKQYNKQHKDGDKQNRT